MNYAVFEEEGRSICGEIGFFRFPQRLPVSGLSIVLSQVTACVS